MIGWDRGDRVVLDDDRDRPEFAGPGEVMTRQPQRDGTTLYVVALDAGPCVLALGRELHAESDVPDEPAEPIDGQHEWRTP